MDAPKVSIIFTSFNHKEYLSQALDALLGQSFEDFELIVVDDCSTDGSQLVLQDYAIRDKRIRLYLNDHNSGSYVYSTNQGAAYARAPYVVFAQCDDYAESTQLEKMAAVLDAYPSVGVVFSASRMVNELGQCLGEDFEVREKAFQQACQTDTFIEKQQMRRYLLHSCVIPNLSAAMVRRELFEMEGRLSSKYVVLADWDFWLKTALKTDFYFIRQPLNNFRQHKTTIRASIKIQRQIEEVFQMYYTFFDIAQMKAKDTWHWKNRIARIWIFYISQGLRAWFGALPTLLKVSMRYNLYFPFILTGQLCVLTLRLIGQKIGIVK
ncbi:glycosyltransferase family 2 protein [Millionella massiliensis]|uniref:glycosyltransferase family 2 protein n=1 Tax=Millionella massiliensis TaxID=1871023 RepID=UPI0024B736E0|nr:glycosyltransferase family 2 protein [Millionella massiliensis]